MNEGLILLDEAGKINFINGSCKNLFHAPSMHYIGKSISLFNRSYQMQSTVDAALKGDISLSLIHIFASGCARERLLLPKEVHPTPLS